MIPFDALTPAELDALELPFDWHTSEDGSAHVVTTEPENNKDRNQCNALALVCNGGPFNADDLASFLADAANAFVKTKEGLERWKAILYDHRSAPGT